MNPPFLTIVEHCTARVWLFHILPRLWRDRTQKKPFSSLTCFLIDRSLPGWWAARATAFFFGFRVEMFRFRMIDVKDAAGLLVQLRVAFMELAHIYEAVRRDPLYRQFEKVGALKGRVETFVYKSLCDVMIPFRGTMGRVVYLIQVADWKRRQLELPSASAITLFLEITPWREVLKSYAGQMKMDLVFVPPAFRLFEALQKKIKALLPQWAIEWGNIYRHRKADLKNAGYRRSLLKWLVKRPRPAAPADPRIGVDYYGQLNINKPGAFSDLFFWQQAQFPGADVALLFGGPFMPYDQLKQAEMAPHGISPVVLRPEATRVFSAPIYNVGRKRKYNPAITVVSKSSEARQINDALARFSALKSNWLDVFRSENLKVYFTWYRYTADHCAIAEAMEENGGVTALFQRSFDALGAPDLAVTADVDFVFSPYSFDIERQSLSKISYCVASGYIGDYRYSLVKKQAQALRESLLKNGARKIITFFDENSMADDRWNTGHDLQALGYRLLCEKVLREPWLGVIFKPKIPRTVRTRLGPYANLLKEAEATGRCVVLQEGERMGAHTPATAALASDLAIHNSLFAGTAGLEAALAGVPTLLLDIEGWHVSPFHQLGEGRVFFKRWEDLWPACHEHFTRQGGIAGFGDWSPVLPLMDPFRDGKAAQRIGAYLQWLLQGFKAGKQRDQVLAMAAERYADAWGADKIVEIKNGNVLPTLRVAR